MSAYKEGSQKWIALLRYWRTFLTADQRLVVRRCMNWESSFTTKKMLGRVREIYCIDPMTWWNLAGSIGGAPSCNMTNTIAESGVEITVTPSILGFAKRSCMYLYWDRKRLDDVGITSTPRKYVKTPMSLSEKQWARLVITLWTCLEKVPVMMMSSTYISRNVVNSFWRWRKSKLSYLEIMKPMDSKNWRSSMYHARGAWWRP